MLEGRAESRRAEFERSSKEGKRVRGAPRGSTPSKHEYQGALLCTPRDDNGGAFSFNAECFGGGHEAGIRGFDGSHAQLLSAPLWALGARSLGEVLEEDKEMSHPLPGTRGRHAVREDLVAGVGVGGRAGSGLSGRVCRVAAPVRDKQSPLRMGEADAAYERSSYSEWTWAREGAKATDDCLGACGLGQA